MSYVIRSISFTIPLSIAWVMSFLIAANVMAQPAKLFVSQSEREIPVVKVVDVIVVGGTVPAVAAAISAAGEGAEVFLIEQKSYLGEDITATLRLERTGKSTPLTEIERNILNGSNRTTPIRVKGVLSKALTVAGVDFVYGSFVTDVIQNEKGEPAGVIMVNRAGRQAVLGKTIIDASQHAIVCQLAGAEFKPWNGKILEFERTIVLPGDTENKPLYNVHRLELPMPNLTYTSFARAEQLARQETYTDGQLRASESLFFIPPNPVVCKKNASEWKNSVDKTEHFRARAFTNLFVLSGYAAISKETKKELLEPGAMAGYGANIGAAAAEASAKLQPSTILTLPTQEITEKEGDIKETLNGLRPVIKTEHPSIVSPETGIPVLGEYDIVVIGGGTSGAPAAISAARMGMKVLVVEFLEGLGGIGTLGLIGKAYHGRKVGFAAEVPFPKGNIEPKMEWYRNELEKAGADIWLGAIGCGAYTDKNKVKGAVVATPTGRGVVKAKVVIDATGNSDVAIAAGAGYRYGDVEKEQMALQGTGFSSRPLIGNYKNSDYLLVDEADMLDVWRALVSVHITKDDENQYDAVPLVQNRERRRIVGDFTLNYLDQIAGRTYPDGIVYSASDYDSHGYPSSPYFALLPHDEESRKQVHPAPGGSCYTPYRCLLPKGLSGILVTGLGISMDRDASAMVRMQLDMANQGYAAGLAASMAIAGDISLRDIDVRELQHRLIEKGNISDEVLEMKDSYPYTRKIIDKAITDYGQATNPQSAGEPLAIILSHKKKAIPMVKKAYQSAGGDAKILYAKLLGMCGERDGVETLIQELRKVGEWSERIYQGRMADFAHLPSPEDGLILALGYSGDKSVTSELLEMVERLDNSVPLSHHRSLALSLEKLGDSRACESLAKLLKKPGMSGHAMLSIEDALTELENDGKGNRKSGSLKKRSNAMREIILARALYHCGDYHGVGEETLKTYLNDMRGLFARHAYSVLDIDSNPLQLPERH